MSVRVIRQPWLINKYFDPVFAIAMGFSAAAIRIQRETKEKSPTADASYPTLWRRAIVMGKQYFGVDSKHR